AAGVARDGDWNSKIAGRIGSSARLARLTGLCMTRPLIIEMTVLLVPELPVDAAAFEKQAGRRDVDGLAVFEHEDLVTIDQGRQAMRNDDHRPAVRDAK